MQRKLIINLTLLVALVFAPAALAADQAQNVDPELLQKLLERIEALEKEVAELKKGQTVTRRELDQVNQQVAQTETQMTKLEEATQTAATTGGHGEAWWDRLSFHGYGEVHYNMPEGKNAKFDVHRLVLGWNYRFNDKFSFGAELDFEHSFSEPELEYANVHWQINDHVATKVGAMLMPFGILNETHEPSLFYSVERPQVEKYLIPTTWQETGIGFLGERGGFSWNAYLTSSLDATRAGDGTKLAKEGVRKMRSKAVEASGEDLALTVDARYTWINGFMIGGSYYTGSADHDEPGLEGVSLDMAALYARFQRSGWDIRGEYVWQDLDNAAMVNMHYGLVGTQSVGSEMNGGYLEVAFDWMSLTRYDNRLVSFLRYETLDTQASVPMGYSADPKNDRHGWIAGLAYYPPNLDNLSFKIDYESWSYGNHTDSDQWNLGVAWMF